MLTTSFLVLVSAVSTMSPLQTVKKTLDDALAIVDRSGTRDEKLIALDQLFGTFLDSDEMCETALGTHRSQLSAEQMKEMKKLFRVLFERTYVQKLLLFERPNFELVSEDLRGKDAAVVVTKLITPKDEFRVGYKMMLKDGHWWATDVQIEDLSLTKNFQRQIDRLLTQGTVESLLDRMRKKYGSGVTAKSEGL